MKRTILFSIKLLIIILFVAILFSYAMFQGGFVSWFLFFGSLPIFLYMALLLIYPISSLKIKRDIKQTVVEAGNALKIEITCKRNPLFPLYYCIVEDIMPESIGYRDTKNKKYSFLAKPHALREKQGAKKIFFPLLKSTFSFEYTLQHIPRGEHTLNQIRVVLGDFTGIVKKEHVFNVETKIVAFPASRKLTLHKTSESFEEGISHSYNRTLKNTTVVSGVRNYAPGDRVTWIDWKSSAKRNEMMTKEFEQEKSNDILLILDATKQENMNWLAFEGAVEITNSLIRAYEQESSRMLFSSLGAQREAFSIQHDFRNNKQVLHHLARVQPTASIPFPEMLKKEFGFLQRGYALMVVTTNITKDLYDALIQIKPRSVKVTLFVVNSHQAINQKEEEILKRLTNYGIVVNVITEEKLIQESFEVNA